MRDVFIILTILILIICGSYFTHQYYDDTKSEFSEKLEIMSEDLKTKKTDTKKIKELEELWQKKEKTLIIFQEHDAIDDIEENLYECFHYYKTNEKEEFDLAKEKLIGEMEDLVKREDLCIVNIF